MARKTALILIFAISLAGLVFAQLSPEYADWADGPQGFLLTDDESKAWEVVKGDQEARKFIALFWARRDPKPGAAFNEFRARFDGMVKYCDENFGYEGMRGALSDMGRVFLLMGPPNNAMNRGPTRTVSAPAAPVGRVNRTEELTKCARRQKSGLTTRPGWTQSSKPKAATSCSPFTRTAP